MQIPMGAPTCSPTSAIFPVTWGHNLELTDREHRVVVAPLNIIQANNQLWDYVYLSIRHSATHGAQLNRTARAQFPDLARGSFEQ